MARTKQTARKSTGGKKSSLQEKRLQALIKKKAPKKRRQPKKTGKRNNKDPTRAAPSETGEKSEPVYSEELGKLPTRAWTGDQEGYSKNYPVDRSDDYEGIKFPKRAAPQDDDEDDEDDDDIGRGSGQQLAADDDASFVPPGPGDEPMPEDTKIGIPQQFTEGGNGGEDAVPSGQSAQSHAASNLNRPLRAVQLTEAHHQAPTQQSHPVVRKYESAFQGDTSGPFVPIRDINPYNSSKIGVKARVTGKTPIKTWSNSRGEGKLFSCDLLDDSGEIRMTFFKEQVDNVFDFIKIGQVYVFRNFFTNSANKQFTTLNNDYDLSSSNDTQVTMCSDMDSPEIAVMSFDFVEIANIESVQKDKIIDVIGICKRRQDCQTFMSRNTNKESTKRDIVLVDKTNREINVTLWGQQATDFEDDTNPVVAIKGVKVSDFAGKSLSCLNSSTVMINPDLNEAHILRGWYDNEGMMIDSVSITVRSQGGTQWKMLREANSMDNPATLEKGDYYMSKVTVMAVKRDNAMYRACPEEKCNKKVIDSGNGFYRCEKCNKDGPDFKWRAMLNVNFADASDHIWATCFQESAEIILGSTADVLGPIFNDDHDQFDGIIKDCAFKSYIGKFKCEMDSFNNENRLRHTVMEIHPMNFGEYAKKLLNEIKETS